VPRPPVADPLTTALELIARVRSESDAQERRSLLLRAVARLDVARFQADDWYDAAESPWGQPARAQLRANVERRRREIAAAADELAELLASSPA
jgi:hypothetical protein